MRLSAVSERKFSDESREKPHGRSECVSQGSGVNIVYQGKRKKVWVDIADVRGPLFKVELLQDHFVWLRKRWWQINKSHNSHFCQQYSGLLLLSQEGHGRGWGSDEVSRKPCWKTGGSVSCKVQDPCRCKMIIIHQKKKVTIRRKRGVILCGRKILFNFKSPQISLLTLFRNPEHQVGKKLCLRLKNHLWKHAVYKMLPVVLALKSVYRVGPQKIVSAVGLYPKQLQ